MGDSVRFVLQSFDLSVLVLQWLRLPDLISYGGVCSATRAIMFLHLHRLTRLLNTELPSAIDSKLLVWLFMHAPNLTHIYLYAIKLSSLETHHFVPNISPHLVELHLPQLIGHLPAPDVDRLHLLRSLRVLNLSDATFESRALVRILSNAPALEVLRLRGATVISPLSFNGDELLVVLGTCNQRLRSLDISFSGFVGITPGAVRGFVQRVTGIQELGLTYVMAFREVSFLFRLFSNPHLTSLSLGDVEAEQDVFLEFAMRCTTLQRLHLINITGAWYRGAFTFMPSLIELNLTNSTLPPEELPQVLSCCSRLTRLCLLGDNVSYMRGSVPPTAVHLRELCVDGNSLECLGGANLFSSVPNLCSLRCALDGDSVLIYMTPLAERLGATLRALTITVAVNTDLPLSRYFEAFPRLRLLTLPNTHLSTVDVEGIVRSCRKLRWLSMHMAFFSGPDSALQQLQKAYSFRMIWLCDEMGDLSAFDASIYDDLCPRELWDD